VGELLDLYLDGLDADERLSAKTRFDYRHSTEDYIRPHLGKKRVRDITPEVILAWQRKLTREGGTKQKKGEDGKPLPGRGLSANTVRLARSPLAGAFKLAMSTGIIATNPVAQVPRPRPARSIPKHWSPEQAREFLALMEGDRTWPVWGFLLGSGLRIGELVWLRWPNVDLEQRHVRVVDFASTLGHDLLPSKGKSRDAVRTIDLDDGLVKVLKAQRRLQAEEALAAKGYEASDFVFTKEKGGAYHPQYLSRTLGAYTEELGLPRLTAHGLRHTSATLMLAGGVPPKVAAERLGHADATLFTNLYSHVTPTMQRDAAERIGSLLFAVDSP
jgi:integrase